MLMTDQEIADDRAVAPQEQTGRLDGESAAQLARMVLDGPHRIPRGSATLLAEAVLGLQRERDALRAEVGAMRDRIATIADEAFGPFPVQSAEENMTAIEQGIFAQRQEAEAMRPVVEAAVAWFTEPAMFAPTARDSWDVLKSAIIAYRKARP